MLKKIILGIVALVVVAVAVAFFALDSASKLTEYDFGSDKVPSVNAVIGEERKVLHVESGTTGGVRYKQYTYETASMVKDLSSYALHLRNNGWTNTKDYNITTGEGEMQLAKESADKGKILVMSVAFGEGRYTIRINKLEGTLTRF